MSNTPILDLPVAIGLTGAEWVPVVQGTGSDAVTKRAQAGLFDFSGGSSGSTQAANTVDAGPTSGAAAAPAFRHLVEADMPYGTSGYALIGNGASPSSATYQGFVATGTGAATRTWQSKAADVVNLKDFGATLGGTTDDTTALTNAITAANGLKPVVIEGGTLLTSNITVSIAGTHIIVASGATWKLKSSTNAPIVTFAASGCTLEGPGTVDGNRSGQTSTYGFAEGCIQATDVSYTTIRGLTVQNTYRDAICGTRSLYMRVEGCTVIAAWGMGIHFFDTCNWFGAVNNDLIGCHTDGISAEGYLSVGVFSNGCQHGVIANNRIDYSSTTTFNTNSGANEMLGCVVWGLSSYCIIADNTVTGPVTALPGGFFVWGFSASAASDYCVLTGNTAHGTQLTFGVELSDCSWASCTGNTIRNASLIGYSITGSGDHSTITYGHVLNGNQAANCAVGYQITGVAQANSLEGNSAIDCPISFYVNNGVTPKPAGFKIANNEIISYSLASSAQSAVVINSGCVEGQVFGNKSVFINGGSGGYWKFVIEGNNHAVENNSFDIFGGTAAATAIQVLTGSASRYVNNYTVGYTSYTVDTSASSGSNFVYGNTSISGSPQNLAGSDTVLPVSSGGTGRATLTNHGVLVGAGTSSITQIAVPAAGTLFQGNSGADPSWTATPTLGVQQTTQGQLVLANTAAGAFPTTLQSSNSASAAWSLTLPTTAGTNLYFLQTNGSGVTSWSPASGASISLTVGTTPITGGNTGRPLYDNGGVLGEYAQIPVAQGGTNASSFTANGILYGNTTSALQVTAAGTSGQLFLGVTSGAPQWGTMSQDATITNAGVLTLASTIVAGGPTGSATVAPIITYDAKGRLTAVSSATITPAVGSITGLGTGVATALGVNVGSAGAFVTFNGALGTPSSGTLSSCSGYSANSLTGGTLNSGVTASSLTSLGTLTALALSNSTAGVQRTTFRNTSNNSSAYTIIDLGNDTSATAGEMLLTSSTNTTYGAGGDLAFFANSGNLIFLTTTAAPITFGVNSATKMTLTSGLQMGAPTGGDKGLGTINVAGDIYKNNTAYTNPRWALQHFYTGKVDEIGPYALPVMSDGRKLPYKGLLTIDEAEAFAKRAHELPLMLHDLEGGMFARGDLLLASLEEAYLYIFQLDKRIKQLEAA